ncbi:MAG: hypothetical protein HYS04_04025 [Acidobacteria bacterium]|nr:hypothetical protein [Acidobacteriota bacterium]
MPTKRILRVSVLTVILVAALRYFSFGSQQAGPSSPDPAKRRMEYRPGGYFPKGFPLHGTVRLLTPPVAEAGRRVPIRVEYIVGDMTIEPGMAIEIWKHFTSDVEMFQTASPDQPAYFGVEFAKAGVKGRTEGVTNWQQRDPVAVFPYRKAARVTVEEGRLERGDKVLFTLGGKHGVRMQHYEENLFNFRFVLSRNNKVLGYAGDAAMRITGGPLHHLRVQAPSIVKLDEPFPIEVVPQDEWVSLARNHTGLALRANLPATFNYDEDLMHYVARDARATEEGVLRIRVHTADGKFEGESNPIWVERNPLRGVYYGELHQHSYLHDGRGVFEELYLYARRVGLLDFGAVSPHHMPMSVTGPNLYLEGKRFPVEEWPALQKATKLMNGWKGFVSVLGYEYSVATKLGGHHNIFYNADEAPSTMQLDPKNPMAPIGTMLKTLQLARKPTLVIPHIGGGPPDWSHPTDPRVERLFEIASVHGVFEESWQRHLEAGLRLAASAAGDTHTTSMGIAYPGLIYTMTNGLLGVYAHSKTRDDIWRGMYERRTFATTGNLRILLDFRVNGEPMGGEVPARDGREVRITARVSGTAPIERVDLMKNSKPIYTLHPSRSRGQLLRVVWGDNIYQRRAAVGMCKGRLAPAGGRLRLERVIHRDQAFEEIRQDGDGISWFTAAVSNDRDGMLADISEVSGDSLHFTLDDSAQLGVMDAQIQLAELREKGHFSWSKIGPVKHPYMEQMGVKPAFFLDCELVDPAGPKDVNFEYVDLSTRKPGDYYYLRVEQLDTNKAWSSPVWMN